MSRLARHMLFLVAVLAIAALSCNAPFMQGNGTTPTPTQSSSASLSTDSAPPQIVIESPANGSQAVVKQPISVRVHATDSVGITRVELHESGRVVVSQPSPDPNPDFTALLEYRPTNVGTITLEVAAYRQSTVSSPATITIMVVGTTAELKNPGSFNPTVGVAAGAICTVRANISGLSLRTGPGVNYRILTTVKVGEELSVIGRNPDSSWYQIKRSGSATIGWVSAGYTLSEGDCSKAPVTTPAPQ